MHTLPNKLSNYTFFENNYSLGFFLLFIVINKVSLCFLLPSISFVQLSAVYIDPNYTTMRYDKLKVQDRLAIKTSATLNELLHITFSKLSSWQQVIDRGLNAIFTHVASAKLKQ